MRVGELATAGATGLDSLIENHMPHSKQWNQDRQKVEAGAAKLTELCDNLKRITQLEEIALQDGLGEQEHAQLVQLGIGKLVGSPVVAVDFDHAVSRHGDALHVSRRRVKR